MIIGKVHSCKLPQATKELCESYSVWRCQDCGTMWVVTSSPRGLKWDYYWDVYTGHVDMTGGHVG